MDVRSLTKKKPLYLSLIKNIIHFERGRGTEILRIFFGCWVKHG